MSRFEMSAFVAAVVAAGCGGGSGGSQGPSIASCPDGQSRANGVCVSACTSGLVCGDVCCAAGEVCTAAGQCSVAPPAGSPCGAGRPACGESLFCDPSTSTCERSSRVCEWRPPKGEFAPRVAWKWTGPTDGVQPEFSDVLSTPVVVALQRQVSDAFLAPAVVFASVTWREGAGVAVTGVLRAVNGRDGTQLWTSDPAHPVNGLAAVAAGDLDGDGFTDFVAARMPTLVPCTEANGAATTCADPKTEGLVAFDHQGRFLWDLVLPTNLAPAPRVGGRVFWGAPSIANLYSTGEANVILGATVIDARGKIVCEGAAGQGSNFLGPISVLADLDLDGVPEIVTGNTVYGNDCKPKPGWPSMQDPTTPWPDGLVAVARFTADPHPQVVTVSGGRVRLTDWQGKVIWGPVELPHATPTLKGGGAPTIGDFDGDGKLEIGVAGDSFYTVFKPFRADGGVNAPASSVLWRKPTQDDSAVTGSSVFDFQNDGAAEVVYGDECYTRVFDGKTGNTVFESQNPSCTVHESPVVADVNRDGRAELVVGTNTVCDKVCTAPDGTQWRHQEVPGRGSQHGLTVFKDLRDRWVSTRPVWNQHAYHVTNVGEDGSIPVKETPHYATPATNNFRMNSMGTVDYSAPDLQIEAGRDLTLATAACPASLTLRVRLWNRGAALVAPGVPVVVFAGAAAVPVARAQTAGAILPGQSETVVLTVSPGPSAPTDLRVVANDDGSGEGVVGECRRENNAVVVPGVRCPPSSQ